MAYEPLLEKIQLLIFKLLMFAKSDCRYANTTLELLLPVVMTEACSIELLKVQVSDTTDDDSSNVAKYKIKSTGAHTHTSPNQLHYWLLFCEKYFCDVFPPFFH